MANYVRAANPIWWIPDLTGLPLNDQYYAFFQQNTAPYSLQNVYQNPTGTPWANPLQFQPSGTLPNNLYFDPAFTYRIQIRKGNTMADPLIWEIDNFTPENSDDTLQTQFVNVSNIFTNPQFADINFTSPLTITTAGTYEIATGWFLKLTGTGSCTLTQIINAAASVNSIPGVPPYFLTIQTSGWTTATLYQQQNNNGGIFTNGSVATSFIASATDSTYPLTVLYADSSGYTKVLNGLNNINIGVSSYITYSGWVNLDPSTNGQQSNVAYTQVQFILQSNGSITFGNMMFIGQTFSVNPSTFINGDIPPFIQPTYEEVVNGEIYEYLPKLKYKPIPSFLTGWDFPLNPCQVLGTNVPANGTAAQYVWDQTILFQTVVNSIGVNRDATTGGIKFFNNGGAAVPCSFAMIQYLANNSTNDKGIFDILQQRVSSQLKGIVLSGTLNGTITLAWGTSIPALPSCVVSSITAGVPTLAGGWTAVPNINFGRGNSVPFTLTNGYAVFDFTGFDATAVNTSSATCFAMIVTFDSLAVSSTVSLSYVSLVGGDIPTRPAPQSFDEVLRECQYYWESNVPTGTLFSAAGLNGAQYIEIPAIYDGTNTTCWAIPFSQRFKQVKRFNTPIISIISALGIAGKISVGVNDNVNTAVQATNDLLLNVWTLTDRSTDSFFYRMSVNNTVPFYTIGAPHTNYQGYMQYNYSADARLGIV